MKFFLIALCIILVLVQSFLCQARALNSPADSFRLKRSLEKRLHSQWGKRAETHNDELYQRILRELYENARAHQLAHPNYLAAREDFPDQWENILENRHQWNQKSKIASENFA